MVRILPITLIAVLMVLPLKLGGLMEEFPAIAQQFDREFGDHERPWATDLKQDPGATGGTVTELTDAAPAAAPASAGGAAAPAPSAAAAAPTQVTFEAPSCTDPLLREAIREQKADTAARVLRARETEAVLAATETRIGLQIDQLKAVKRDVEALMVQRQTMAEADLKRMVAIYEAMKPRDAARILDTLETTEVVEVLDRLAERRAAPILAAMTDAKAREVTQMILQRRALPGDRTTGPATAAVLPRTVATN